VAPSPANKIARGNKLARVIAGAAVLLILLMVGFLLIPPYAANWRLQSYINDLADDPATAKNPAETVRTQVLNQAAGLGLPVHGDDIHVSIAQGVVNIGVLYIVHVDVAGYTIDLHFRPTAGS
jgi:hypothetical protein